MKLTYVLAVAAMAVSARAGATQVVIQEVTYTHGPSTTRDSHYTIDNLAGTPRNWVSPVDYTKGTAVVRLEVFTKPSDANTRFQICFEGSPYSCTNQAPVYTKTGVYTWSSKFSEFYSPGRPTYTNAPTKMSLILKDDKNGKPAPENVGATTAARYMPTQVRVTVTLVSEGATYVPPDDTDDELMNPPGTPGTPETPGTPTTPADPEAPTDDMAQDDDAEDDLPAIDLPSADDEAALADDAFSTDVSGGCNATGPSLLPVLVVIAVTLIHRYLRNRVRHELPDGYVAHCEITSV